MKNEEQQIELIEEAFKKAHQEQVAPEISDNWQSSVMAAIRQEDRMEDVEVNRTEILMFRLSWVAAGIAALLVLMFGLFFKPSFNENTIEDDFQNLYEDALTNDVLTINSP